MLFGLLSVVLASQAAAWSIKGGTVGIAAPGDPGELVNFEDAGVLSLGPSRTLNVAWSIPEAPPAPRQVSLRLHNEICDYTAAAKVRGSKAKVVLTYHSLPACLSGTVQADVLVAGGSSTPSRLENAFSLQVQEIAKPDLDARVERPMAIEPEIVHQFRGEPKRVNPVVALVFVGAIVGLFLVLLSLWTTQVGLGFASWPFTLSLVSLELVFVNYFISASIFKTMFYGACHAPVVFFTGQQALRKDRQRRVGTSSQ